MATEHIEQDGGGEPQENAEPHDSGASQSESKHTRVFFLRWPMHAVEMNLLKPVNEWLQSLAIFDILDRVGKGLIVLSLVLYIGECGSRQDATTNQAWAVFAAASGKPGDLGRRQAFASLINLGADLRYVDLSGGNYQDMQLGGVDLSEVKFEAANLARAKLSGAWLYKAELSGAILWDADLSRATLWKANLRGARLNGANLSGADLKGANLSGAYLVLANLSGTDLKGANLSGAMLHSADLSGAWLSGAKLDGAIVHTLSWLEDVLNPAYGEPVKDLDPDDWRVVQEDRDGQAVFVVRPAVDSSAP